MLMRIIDEMKRSIDNECFIAALMLALSIPDICGKAEYPDTEKLLYGILNGMIPM